MLLFFVGLLLKHESGTTAPHPLSSQTLKEAPDRAQACWEYTSSKKLAQNTVPHKSSSTFQTTANRSDQKSSTKPVLFLRHREVRPQRLLSCATASSVSEKPDCDLESSHGSHSTQTSDPNRFKIYYEPCEHPTLYTSELSIRTCTYPLVAPATRPHAEPGFGSHRSSVSERLSRAAMCQVGCCFRALI